MLNANIAAESVDKEALTKAQVLLTEWLGIFGIDTAKLIKQNETQGDDEIVALVEQRDEARKNKDWAKSDQLRDQLKQMGVIIEDTPQGTRWIRE